jgi:hypothetical protein
MLIPSARNQVFPYVCCRVAGAMTYVLRAGYGNRTQDFVNQFSWDLALIDKSTGTHMAPFKTL